MFMAFILHFSGVKAAKCFHRERKKNKALEAASTLFPWSWVLFGQPFSIFESVSLIGLEVLSTIH